MIKQIEKFAKMNRHNGASVKLLQPLDKGYASSDAQSPQKRHKSDVNRNSNNNSASETASDVDFRERSNHGDNFIKEALPRLLERALECVKNRDGKVLDFVQPDVLKKEFDFRITEVPTNNKDLEKLLEKTIDYSVKTGHPYFFNQLFGGLDKLALSAAILTETLNTSAYTYEAAPVFSLMEKEVLQKIIKEMVGWPQGDGIFTPGGSASNMYGVSLARHHKFPESKVKGMRALPNVHIYTSKLCHYSLKKAACFMGFGLDSIIPVETDKVGRMIPAELEKCIKQSLAEGAVPLMVNATSGTTVMGAFDPLNQIADICDRNGGIWLHVDGAWGGAVLLSDKLKHKMAGIDRVDSLTWDPHKMIGSVLQCAVLVTKHLNLLNEAHSANARYLFQQDKVYDVSYDSGDKSIQCGRKIDAFKLWVQWKAYGSLGMAQRVESCFECALHLRDRCRTTPGFRLLIEDPECTNVCFWYIPPSLRGQEENAEWWDKLSKVAPAIKAQMQITGTMMIGYQPQGEYVNFFRMVIASADNTTKDMDKIIDVITKFGEKL